MCAIGGFSSPVFARKLPVHVGFKPPGPLLPVTDASSLTVVCGSIPQPLTCVRNLTLHESCASCTCCRSWQLYAVLGLLIILHCWTQAVITCQTKHVANGIISSFALHVLTEIVKPVLVAEMKWSLPGVLHKFAKHMVSDSVCCSYCRSYVLRIDVAITAQAQLHNSFVTVLACNMQRCVTVFVHSVW
eukprot:TRINITY_DN3773_c0_g1_i1.p1 TRINITY_DN3773_c0_g1~~TRINITY_DN3773_c0_g1_i1.p1  ORF type:complete len:188 (+),score=5.70 TRINITY_DN3773_c0_g1_i1:302-865(+)